MKSTKVFNEEETRKLVPISEEELESAYGAGCVCPSSKRGNHNRMCCQHDCWTWNLKGSKFISSVD